MNASGEKRISNKALTVRLLGFSAGMFAFGFLVLPPLYDAFCDITGFGGRTNPEAAVVTEAPDKKRTIRIEFATTVNEYAPWEFAADVDSMDVHPGKLYYATFTATNLDNKKKVGQAVPSVAPGLAAAYFQKTECFCFTQQKLEPGEEKIMPVTFIVDSELPSKMNELILSYTFFTSKQNNQDSSPSLALSLNQDQKL